MTDSADPYERLGVELARVAGLVEEPGAASSSRWPIPVRLAPELAVPVDGCVAGRRGTWCSRCSSAAWRRRRRRPAWWSP